MNFSVILHIEPSLPSHPRTIEQGGQSLSCLMAKKGNPRDSKLRDVATKRVFNWGTRSFFFCHLVMHLAPGLAFQQSSEPWAKRTWL